MTTVISCAGGGAGGVVFGSTGGVDVSVSATGLNGRSPASLSCSRTSAQMRSELSRGHCQKHPPSPNPPHHCPHSHWIPHHLHLKGEKNVFFHLVLI